MTFNQNIHEQLHDSKIIVLQTDVSWRNCENVIEIVSHLLHILKYSTLNIKIKRKTIRSYESHNTITVNQFILNGTNMIS